jgi:hypothetical protein
VAGCLNALSGLARFAPIFRLAWDNPTNAASGIGDDQTSRITGRNAPASSLAPVGTRIVCCFCFPNQGGSDILVQMRNADCEGTPHPGPPPGAEREEAGRTSNIQHPTLDLEHPSLNLPGHTPLRALSPRRGEKGSSWKGVALLLLGLVTAAQGQEAVRMSIASAEAAEARRQAATTVGYYNLKLGPTAVVIGRVHALEGGGTKSGWKAANRRVGQDLDASV